MFTQLASALPNSVQYLRPKYLDLRPPKHDVGPPRFPFAEKLLVHPLYDVWDVGLCIMELCRMNMQNTTATVTVNLTDSQVRAVICIIPQYER